MISIEYEFSKVESLFITVFLALALFAFGLICSISLLYQLVEHSSELGCLLPDLFVLSLDLLHVIVEAEHL